MKNKGAYLLLPLVLALWILIGYRIYKYIRHPDVILVNKQAEDITTSPVSYIPDTFNIEANYRDPFLGSIYPHEEAKSIVKTASIPKPLAAVKSPWPVIIYKGIIRNKDSNKALALLTVNGKLKSLTENDNLNGIKVIAIERDSLTVTFEGERRFFHKTGGK